MNRAARRRDGRQQVKALPKDDILVDVVVWTGGGFDPTACLESLPKSGVKPVVCGSANPYQGRNDAAMKGHAPYIAFIDADTLLTEADALASACSLLSTRAAVVGGLLMHPGGYVFAAGYAINAMGRPYHRFSQWRPDHRKVQESVNLQAVPLSLMVTRRDVWRAARFRPEYGDLPYGDADYCMRVRSKGAVLYDPSLVASTTGQLLPAPNPIAAQLFASTQPAWDEHLVL